VKLAQLIGMAAIITSHNQRSGRNTVILSLFLWGSLLLLIKVIVRKLARVLQVGICMAGRDFVLRASLKREQYE
jgi:hypothetical protein